MKNAPLARPKFLMVKNQSASVYPSNKGFEIIKPTLLKFIASIIFLIVFIFNFIINCEAQNPLSSPPPIDWAATPGAIPNLANFRGMYVSKADILIDEIKNNTISNNTYDDNANGATPKTREMFHYAVDNYFTYIAIYSLAKANPNNPTDHDPLIGNSAYAPAIRSFLAAAHSKGIKVGFVVVSSQAIDGNNVPNGSSAGYMNYVTSDFYYDFSADFLPNNCTYYATKLANGNEVSYAAKGDFPDSIKINPDSMDYFNVNRSEMIKQALRLLKYSYDTKIWHSSIPVIEGDDDDPIPIDEIGDRYSNTNIVNTASKVPPLANYLFDYISLEYEFWDNNEYNKFDVAHGCTQNCGVNGIISPNRLAWNTFTDVSDAIFFVYKKMCSNINTELEFRLVPPNITANGNIPNYDLSEGIFDPNWGEIPPSEAQVAFITKYYNRLLLTDYKNGTVGSVSNIISRTADAQTLFAQNQGTVGSNRNLIVPLFSAEDALEKRNDFGDQSAYIETSVTTNCPAPPCTTLTAQPFFGKLLKMASPAAGLPWQHLLYSDPNAGWSGWGDNPYPGNTLAYFEHEFMMQTHEAAYYNNGGNGCNCDPYSNQPSPCNFSNSYNAIAGYMWFKYEFLNNTLRSPISYHRLLKSKADSPSSLYGIVNYNNSTSELLINLPNKNALEKAEFELYSINGKLIFKKELSVGYNKFLLNELSHGIYIYSIISNTNLQTGKLSIIR